MIRNVHVVVILLPLLGLVFVIFQHRVTSKFYGGKTFQYPTSAMVADTSSFSRSLEGNNNSNNRNSKILEMIIAEETKRNQTSLRIEDVNASAVSQHSRVSFNLSADESATEVAPSQLAGLMGSDKTKTESPIEVLTSSFFVNNIMTTRDPVNMHCHRTCVDFRNQIYLSSSTAGLIDRLTTLGTVLNLAGYLCARLYVPRPRIMLMAGHNRGQSLDANLSWSDFGEFVFWNDPQRDEALIDWDNRNDLTTRPDEASVLNSSVSDLIVRTELPRQFKRDFSTLESYTFGQQRRLTQDRGNPATSGGFVWLIHAEYFDWAALISNHFRKRPLPAHYLNETERIHEPTIHSPEKLNPGCQYAKVRLPLSLRQVREKIVRQIIPQPESISVSDAFGLQPPIVGYFHIRRKDAANECDTSLNRIRVLLRCSFREAMWRLVELPLTNQRRRVIVLFSSDEDNAQYRTKVMNILEQIHIRPSDTNPVQVTSIDFDHLVDRTLRKEVEAGQLPATYINNFHIFQLIFSIGYNTTDTQFHMEQRRQSHCECSDNVTKQLIKSGALGTSSISG